MSANSYTYASENYYEYLPSFDKKVNSSIQNLENSGFLQKFFNFNYFLWSDTPEEISNRLGWLYIPFVMKEAVPQMNAFADEIKDEGFKHILLLGMGGSSLSGDVFKDVFGVRESFPDLTIVDTTDPEYFSEILNEIDLKKSLFIVSTKSGGTVETLSAMNFFYNQIGKNPGGKFVGITDPGSRLLDTAKKYGFRKIFVNDPNIGGRFSVLSYFGLVPASLIGVDIEKLLDNACAECTELKDGNISLHDKVSLRLGVVLGEMAKLGKDKLTFLFSDDLYSFGYWAEQLIAESTGKKGVGILPVLDQKNFSENHISNDRLFVFFTKRDDKKLLKLHRELSQRGMPILKIVINNNYEIGREFFRFEFATAVAGALLKINPFDQPDVESAKIMARKYLENIEGTDAKNTNKFNFSTDSLNVLANVEINSFGDIAKLLQNRGFQYISIHSYVNPSPHNKSEMMELRDHVENISNIPVTLGFGPRFLHSTGQLHKGDSGKGLFLQIVSENCLDLNIPDNPGSEESQLSFSMLKFAQAAGDYSALDSNGRTVVSIHITHEISKCINNIIHLLG